MCKRENDCLEDLSSGYDVKSLNFSGIFMWTMQGIAKFNLGYITCFTYSRYSCS